MSLENEALGTEEIIDAGTEFIAVYKDFMESSFDNTPLQYKKRMKVFQRKVDTCISMGNLSDYLIHNTDMQVAFLEIALHINLVLMGS